MASVSKSRKKSEGDHLVDALIAKVTLAILGCPSVAFIDERALICLRSGYLPYAL